MRWEVPDRTEASTIPEGDVLVRRVTWRMPLTWALPGRYQQEEIPSRAGGAGTARPAQGAVRLREGARRGPPGRACRTPPLSIGPRLRALAVYLVVFQHVPVERCRS